MDEQTNTHNATVTLEDATPGTTILPPIEAQTVAWKRFPDADSLRAHIFTVPDIKEETIAIPEWEVEILVRGLNAKIRSRILQGAMKKDGTPDLEKMYPDLVIATAYSPEDRQLIFRSADRDSLNEKAGGIIERLAMIAARLSGLDATSQEQTVQNFQK